VEEAEQQEFVPGAEVGDEAGEDGLMVAAAPPPIGFTLEEIERITSANTDLSPVK